MTISNIPECVYDIGILQYEVDTNIKVDMEKDMDFLAVVICNNNKVHCQHLYGLTLECEKSSCPRRELYCKLYAVTKCREAPVPTNGSICLNYNFGKLKHNELYAQLETWEMKKLAHKPKNMFKACEFISDQLTANDLGAKKCESLIEHGGTKLFSVKYGVCYSYNFKNFTDGKTDSKGDMVSLKQIMPGAKGLELVLDIEGLLFSPLNYSIVFYQILISSLS